MVFFFFFFLSGWVHFLKKIYDKILKLKLNYPNLFYDKFVNFKLKWHMLNKKSLVNKTKTEV